MERRGAARPTRRRLLVAAGAVGAGLVAGCAGTGPGTGGDWLRTELTPVRGGEPFTLGGLAPPVVVQALAPWSRRCERQSAALAGVDDRVARVGLNVDPLEDAAAVRRYAETRDPDWRFAVPPREMGTALVDAFGTAVTTAQHTPLLVVCPDGSVSFDAGRVRSAAAIEAMAGDC